MGLIKKYRDYLISTKKEIYNFIDNKQYKKANEKIYQFSNDYMKIEHVISRILLSILTVIQKFLGTYHSMVYNFKQIISYLLYRQPIKTYSDFGSYGIYKILVKHLKHYYDMSKFNSYDEMNNKLESYIDAMEDIILYYENEEKWAIKHNLISLYNSTMDDMHIIKQKSSHDLYIDKLDIPQKIKNILHDNISTIHIKNKKSSKKYIELYENEIFNILDNDRKQIDELFQKREQLWI